ncbi:MAG: hypothetical protein A3H96_09185 [Acidobacteria bacterium RIFCSPLOWO2_02_FULL_67_36]|nr:MAG: hypothetical protein A3H96_09185 [Acidobacteria bacterium RIFCSPLOWO2_02_FULL_67_36]OFW25051.1 MAG: hypothetical protein A3G21_16550 [Acidobacteria bacterium RIFCSPLOWO2_12_FULL_66_21]
MRVGRAALDEEAIRLIEESNPDVSFDWTRILKGDEAPAPEPEPRAESRRAPKTPPRRERAVEPARATEPEPVAEPESVAAPRADEPMTAALARLGAEGLLRLRGRFAEVMTRIAEKTSDPVKLEELKTQAERLNPDTWVTDAEVTAGLEQYETVFDALRGVIGHRRRRRRPKPARGPADTAASTGGRPSEPPSGSNGGEEL